MENSTQTTLKQLDNFNKFDHLVESGHKVFKSESKVEYIISFTSVLLMLKVSVKLFVPLK